MPFVVSLCWRGEVRSEARNNNYLIFNVECGGRKQLAPRCYRRWLEGFFDVVRLERFVDFD
jgi:hypothetical protein